MLPRGQPVSHPGNRDSSGNHECISCAPLGFNLWQGDDEQKGAKGGSWRR